MYEPENCYGYKIIIPPDSEYVQDLRQLDFDDTLQSLGQCTDE